MKPWLMAGMGVWMISRHGMARDRRRGAHAACRTQDHTPHALLGQSLHLGRLRHSRDDPADHRLLHLRAHHPVVGERSADFAPQSRGGLVVAAFILGMAIIIAAAII